MNQFLSFLVLRCSEFDAFSIPHSTPILFSSDKYNAKCETYSFINYKEKEKEKQRGMTVVDGEYLKEIEGARRDLRALISSKNCAPIMLRLA